MNKLDKQYTDLLQTILDYGVDKKDRTGTGTKSIFGYTIRHNMKDGFPLLTTKKMYMKGVITELLWFLRGDTNIKFLVDNNCHIWDGDAYKNYEKWWKSYSPGGAPIPLSQEEFINRIKTDDEFAKKWGDLGPVYGKQWRSWETNKNLEVKGFVVGLHMEYGFVPNPDKISHIDQISNLIQDLKTNPDSRRLMVNAWNVGQLDSMVLPPCHYGFQVYTRELSNYERIGIQMNINDYRSYYSKEDLDGNNIPTRAISLMWNQRSVDTGLGLPFNIASYGLLLEIIAKEVNMVPDQLIGNLGDTHLYSNHIEQAKEQIGRELRVDERVCMCYENPNLDLSKLQEGMSDEEFTKVCDEFKIPRRTRTPFELPTLKIENEVKWTEGDCLPTYSITDFTIENYQSHPTIKAPLSN
jgi:thymidylate synthase